MIFVDTNVIIDVVSRDPVWVDWSREQLNDAAAIDRLAINEVVYAELSGSYRQFQELDELINEAGLALVPTSRQVLFVAGKAFQRYRISGGIRTGVLADFFIGAQALVLEAPLITRDSRRYLTYFPGIELITPNVN